MAGPQQARGQLVPTAPGPDDPASPAADGDTRSGGPAAAAAPGAGPPDRELAALRRELAQLRHEVLRLRERVQHLDGELGFAMMTSGRLRGRLDREVAHREALEQWLAERGLVVLEDDALPGQPGSVSRSRRAAARSGTRSFLTDVDT